MDSAWFLQQESEVSSRDLFLLSQKGAGDRLALPHNATENQ